MHLGDASVYVSPPLYHQMMPVVGRLAVVHDASLHQRPKQAGLADTFLRVSPGFR